MQRLHLSCALLALFLEPSFQLARPSRLAQNVAGNFFVASNCIDCDVCRWMAPDTFGRTHNTLGGKSFVHTQPTEDEGVMRACEAAVACPVGAIRTERGAREAARVKFPLAVDEERLPHVYHLGYHSKDSFGATPYLVLAHAKESDGAESFDGIMVDSPRYSSRLAKEIEAVVGGPPKFMFLTHKDDVADHIKWKERFPSMVRIMHKLDVKSADEWPYIEMRDVEVQLEGDGPWQLDGMERSGAKVVFTPGHSVGSASLVVPQSGKREGAVFTGDHLAFNGRLGRLDGFARFGRDLKMQADSMEVLGKEQEVQWILPGHGRKHGFKSPKEYRASVTSAAEDFRKDPLGEEAPGAVFVNP